MDKLKVFISWSGKRSFTVARELRVWLRNLIQAAEPVISEDIESGLVYFNRLVEMLKEADFVILCLTPENMRNLWMIFEAGVVLGGSDRTTNVCPYLVDSSSRRRSLPEPLKFFWALRSNKEDTYKLVRDINRAAGNFLSEIELETAFEKQWPELEKVLNSIGPAPSRVPLQVCIHDFEKVRGCIDKHQKELDGPFNRCIEVAIKDYERTRIVELAYEEIERNKTQFKTVQSLLVGNVYEFLSLNFTKEKLRDIIVEMEWDLFSSSNPEEARASLKDLALRSSYKEFSDLHRILLDRFYACLMSGED